ncbi:hypothetical protein PCIT_a4322 [Pseudoalteromonas citrea]|uniref:N-acetyltransferase domain-containing protein n=2 Tax=Pseudoalteromonas citrea TaxID=43655 RepID=A0AAD4AII1_9GAMM|nr:GNAT family N-acetyltransferase [Pseudoalteromonas citrea]KAF7771255.1 hypothetical protein PCIT_a4322 [Pseudoalteromonas citrea]
MEVRKVQEKDLVQVNLICIRSFEASIAGSLGCEGITTFIEIAKSSAFLKRMQQDNTILVAEDKQRIVAVIELKAGHHIAMFFVDPDFQNKGVGRALFNAILPHVRTDILTVSASLSSIDIYKKYGFKYAGEVGESAGLVYQPMELKLSSSERAV